VLADAADLLLKRMGAPNAPNDGKQTPSRDIRYSSRSTPRRPAAVAVWQSGIERAGRCGRPTWRTSRQ
jgi:hypothetical protein